jgi:hypothetical protein
VAVHHRKKGFDLRPSEEVDQSSELLIPGGDGGQDHGTKTRPSWRFLSLLLRP